MRAVFIVESARVSRTIARGLAVPQHTMEAYGSLERARRLDACGRSSDAAARTARGFLHGPQSMSGTLADLITLAHLSVSSPTTLPKSAGVPGMAMPPSSASRAL